MRQLETNSTPRSSASAASCSTASIPVAVPIWSLNATRVARNSHLHPAISLASLVEASLERLFQDTVDRLAGLVSTVVFARAGLTKIARPGKPVKKSGDRRDMKVCGIPNQRECGTASVLRSSSDGIRGQFTSGENGMPLIKASSTVAAATVPMCTGKRNGGEGGTTVQTNTAAGLSGRCVLCIDGRAALYPEYRRAVEASGGNLLIYRSQPQRGAERQPLPALLEQADMVICPVDCVNHYAFYTVKRYCQYSGTPCVLLERSGLSTFQRGIAALAALTASPAQA